MSRYIDADALKQWIKDVWDWDRLDDLTTITVLRQTLSDIDDQPTADVVERKRGEWLYKDMKGQLCSVCGKQSVWKFDFCSNCGADMRGDND